MANGDNNMEHLGLTTHDLMMLLVWPLLTALMNGAVALAGKSEHPLGKFLAAVGTQLLKSKK